MLNSLTMTLFAGMALVFSSWTSFGTTAEAPIDDSATAAVVSTGTLKVSTVDGQGKPVQGALVNVFPLGTSTVAASGSTDNKGRITFSNLAEGDYSVFASKVTVILVGGIPVSSAIFGGATATVKAGKPTRTTVALTNSAP